jgi:hypothetical protein
MNEIILIQELLYNLNNVRASKLSNDKKAEIYDKLVSIYFGELISYVNEEVDKLKEEQDV